MTELTWSKERQAAAYDRYAEREFARMIRWVKDHQGQIIAEGRARMLGIGFDQYGDTSFQLTYAELEQGKLEEVADMLVYGVIQRARGWS